MYIYLGLLLIITFCRAQLTCNTTTYDVYYFDKCLADPQCKKNFHLHSDEQWAFTRMLNDELLEPMNLNATVICGDELIWMAVLRTFDVCTPNHRRDFDGTCILVGDKLEDPPIWHKTGLTALTSPLINVGILIIVLWLAARQLDDWKSLQKQFETKMQILETTPAATAPSTLMPVSVPKNVGYKLNFD
jgi:hypothetical protein